MSGAAEQLDEMEGDFVLGIAAHDLKNGISSDKAISNPIHRIKWQTEKIIKL